MGRVLIIGVGILLSVASAPAQSQQLTPITHHHKYTQSSEASDAEKHEASPRKTFWERTTDDPVAFFTFWLTIFTAVLAVSTIGLWIVTWRSSKKQSADMRESLAIAKESADAAAAGAAASKASSDAFVNSKRPHITLVPKLRFINEVFPHIDCTITNSGESIAFVSRYRMEIHCGPEIPPKRKFRYAKPWKGWHILKDASHSLDTKITFKKAWTPKEIADFRREKFFIFFFGYVIFEDTFGHRRERGFGFRYSLSERRYTKRGGKIYNYDKCEKSQ